MSRKTRPYLDSVSDECSQRPPCYPHLLIAHDHRLLILPAAAIPLTITTTVQMLPRPFDHPRCCVGFGVSFLLPMIVKRAP
ncbi:hypothetical protein EJ02DRAFT_27206 [Clathrospora elynae]|uniref:Uncharacterized protein n=1 Tax=Clathrospora elynae TaxID=706981 RepID=A0A6A5SEE0_9PLEO|nr:hypothetical protein EJ02DRAFT_27206 [Clathrospora elynae]